VHLETLYNSLRVTKSSIEARVGRVDMLSTRKDPETTINSSPRLLTSLCIVCPLSPDRFLTATSTDLCAMAEVDSSKVVIEPTPDNSTDLPVEDVAQQGEEEAEDENSRYDRLLQKSAPVVYFERDECHYPIRYEKLLEHSNLYFWPVEISPLIPKWHLVKAGGLTPQTLREIISGRDERITKWKLRPLPEVRVLMANNEIANVVLKLLVTRNEPSLV